jgi:hypothetical protein
MDAQATVVLGVILHSYVAEGAGPNLARIGAMTGLRDSSVLEAIGLLRRLDLVVTESDKRTISVAYPFTERLTPHSVTFAGNRRTVRTMCAIDALGTGPMCRQDLEISSICGLCSQPIAATVANGGMTLRGILPASSVVWVSLSASQACAADTVCPEFLFFCSDDHLKQWCAKRDPREGHRLSPEEAFQVGKALFINRAVATTNDWR